MSFMLPVLNAWLRWTEKPQMARAKSPEKLRRSFEMKAKLFFHAPLGTRFSEMKLAGLEALKVTPKAEGDGPVLLYFHGGAYIFGNPQAYSALLGQLVKRTGGHAILVDYGKAPERPFPAAPDDALASYTALLEQGVDPARIIIGGDSAGGGLALTLLGQIVAQGLAMPAGVFAFSPVTDLSYSSDSVRENAEADVVLPVAQIQTIQEMYLGGHDPRDPRVSAAFADYSGACPVWLSVGDTEILRDDSLRVAERLKAQGVDVDLTVVSDHPHVWPLFHNILPEARQTLDQLAAWVTQRLSR